MPQSLSQIYVHLIFSTKKRVEFLADETRQAKVHAYLAGICQNLDCGALKIGGTADHVHLLFTLSRQKALAELVREVKTGATKWIKENFADLTDFHWQDGYGAFSVSQSQLEKVIAYIATQKEHHRKQSFQAEFITILKRYKVKYDEKYIWD